MVDLNPKVGPRGQGGVIKRAAALGLVAALIALQAATQYAAAVLGYAPELGMRAGEVFPPWGVLVWAWRWHAPFAPMFKMAAEVGVGTWGAVIALVAYLWPKRKVTDSLHGSSRWARLEEVRAAGLIGRECGDSVVVGGFRDGVGRKHLLRDTSHGNVLVFAPPRSGKGVGLVVPSLLTWAHSALVTDLRGELYQLTAGYRRALGHRVQRFAPGEIDSVRWNPLDEVRAHTAHEIGDVQTIANLIVDPDGKGLADHWQKTAQSLLVGVILHAIHEDNYRATLSRVDGLLSDPSMPITELWARMAESEHPTIAASGRDMLDRPGPEAGSVLSTVKSYLALYRDPVVAKNTSFCDFRVRDLMHKTKAHSLYLVTQPADKDRLRPLVRLMVSMAVRTLAADVKFESGEPVQHYKHRLLMLLDEFPTLGKLPILAESLAFLGGYGIKTYLICQDTVQLKAVYGADETITAACHVQAAYAPNRMETARYLSELLGKATVRYESPNKGQKGESKTTHWAARPLLTADECRTLPGPRKTPGGRITHPGHMLIIVAGCRPIYGVQPLYFQDAILRGRAEIPAGLNSAHVAA